MRSNGNETSLQDKRVSMLVTIQVCQLVCVKAVPPVDKRRSSATRKFFAFRQEISCCVSVLRADARRLLEAVAVLQAFDGLEKAIVRLFRANSWQWSVGRSSRFAKFLWECAICKFVAAAAALTSSYAKAEPRVMFKTAFFNDLATITHDDVLIVFE